MKKFFFLSTFIATVFMALAFAPNNTDHVDDAVMMGCCGEICVTPGPCSFGTSLSFTLNNETTGTSTPIFPNNCENVNLDVGSKYTLTITATGGTCYASVSYDLCGNTGSAFVEASPNKPATVELVQGNGPFCF